MLSPGKAVIWAAFFNFVAAFGFETAVAKTIGSGMVDINTVMFAVVFAGLMGAIVWDLITWYVGLPTSSSHALIGGYAGAAVAKSGVAAIIPSGWTKTLEFIVLAPLIGLLLGLAIMTAIFWIFRWMPPSRVDRWFRKLQLVSAAFYSLGHGTNDAQKTMGIIALALFTGTKAGAFKNAPEWAQFLNTPDFKIQPWVIFTCAGVMAAGTAAGGWRIIRTMGHKMVKLQPVHGFAAETTAAIIIQIASTLGIPVSTTHVISTSIMGVGAMKRFSAVKWGVVERIVWAWVLTLPVTGLIGYLTLLACRYFGMH